MFRIINSGRLSWADHMAHMVEVRNVYRILVGKLRGKNAWETIVDETIKMDLFKGTEYEGVG
jgi:hypothetical protein